MKRLIIVMLLIISSVSFSQNGTSLWKTNPETSTLKIPTNNNLPRKHLYDLDVKSLRKILATAPKRNPKAHSSTTIISLPNGDGVFENFKIYENSIMDEKLAAKYPEIKSYIAEGVESSEARVYFSLSPLGFKSMILHADKSTSFIEPYSSDLVTYTVYNKSDVEESINKFECSVIDKVVHNKINATNTRLGADDGKLRTLRLALSCTGEYTTYFGGTKALALAAMNNTMTRCNGIFETDFGLRLVLIANNDAVIYTNALTDPYSDATSISNWNSQVQSTLTSVIGESNYDIGHLFGGTGGGGNAGCIGCIGVNGSKGSGYTSPSNGIPAGDNFDIDYVAHEMGHQLGANHTFTHGTETGSIAQMEPGSGSTIMGYAGITAKDVQRHSDAYFHAVSIQQVTNNIKSKTCATIITTGNAVPVVSAGLDYSIPKGTPFMLTGSATDANADDVLTYNWEEMDLGGVLTSTPSSTATAGPIFRSYLSSSSPTRYFPKMATVLAGLTTTSGTEIQVEVLPTVARTLNFRLTVRDNRVGGSANNTDDTVITVNSSAGPFTVSSPNSAVTYTAQSAQTVTWNVAGTTANGINCANVDVLLSTDGGLTFPTTLLSDTPNDGSENIVIPNIAGNNNRIMIKGSNHIFFDVSDTSFSITSSAITTDTTAPTMPTLNASGTTATSVNLSWTAASDNVGVSGYDIYQNGAIIATTTATTYLVSGLSTAATYNFYIIAKDAAGNTAPSSNVVTITTLFADTVAPTTVTLTVSETTATSANLSWTGASDNVGISGYDIYQNGVFKASTTTTTYLASGLSASTTYSFYVIAKDTAGNTAPSSNVVTITTLLIDTIAPTMPTLTASGTTALSTNLSWTTASDNVGVTGYDLYQNGVFRVSTNLNTFFADGLSPSTTYNFYVIAKDAAGNKSQTNNNVNITTLSIDTSAPTTPTLAASGTTMSATNLSWSTAIDNVGITGYDVYQNGIFKTTTTATTYVASGLSALTTYNFYVIAKDAAGNASNSNSLVVVTLTNVVSYCSSYGKSTSREYINKVQLGVINNLSGNNNGYGDFTAVTTNLALGSSNSIVITPAWNGVAVTESYRVWIDYNQDGDFLDSGEQVLNKSKTKSSAVSGSFIIPTTALLGTTRMRVSMKYNAFPTCCEIFSNGEVEDYTVTINAAGKFDEVSVDKPISSSSFNVYPNPVSGDVLNISNLDKPSDFRIFDMMGKELDKNHIENNEIFVGSLNRGIYFIEVTNDTSKTTKRFIKE